jgi:hypothetical protein
MKAEIPAIVRYEKPTKIRQFCSSDAESAKVGVKNGRTIDVLGTLPLFVNSLSKFGKRSEFCDRWLATTEFFATECVWLFDAHEFSPCC